MARRLFDDQFTIVYQLAIRKDDETPSGSLAVVLDCVLDVGPIADRSNANRNFLGIPGYCDRLYKLPGIFVGGICYEHHLRNPAIELQQQLDPLAPGCEFEIGEACDVAAGTS